MNAILTERGIAAPRSPGPGATLAMWVARARSRRQLLALDDRLLADIGLTRADVHHEARKPFWVA